MTQHFMLVLRFLLLALEWLFEGTSSVDAVISLAVMNGLMLFALATLVALTPNGVSSSQAQDIAVLCLVAALLIATSAVYLVIVN